MTTEGGQRGPRPGEEIEIPVVEERVTVGTRPGVRGRVRVSRRVEEREEAIDIPLTADRVEVERVPIGRFVDEPPEVRREGDTLIIPCTEEVVQTRLRLREEIRVRLVTEQTREERAVKLRRAYVEVERTGQDSSESPQEPRRGETR